MQPITSTMQNNHLPSRSVQTEVVFFSSMEIKFYCCCPMGERKQKNHLQGTKQPLQDLNRIILQDYLHKATQIPAAYIASCY